MLKRQTGRYSLGAYIPVWKRAIIEVITNEAYIVKWEKWGIRNP